MLKLLIQLWIGSAVALTTAYISFDHPEDWGCELAQGVWICQSKLDSDRRESVVLSIATVATDWDTLENYEAYLKKGRTIEGEDGKPVESKVSYTRRRKIRELTWIDSLHQNSELPGFWTRYLATVHKAGQHKIGILVTYVVSEEKYADFAPKFERMVASLKPNESFDLNEITKQTGTAMPGTDTLGPTARDILEPLRKKPTPPPPKPQASGSLVWIALIVILGAAAAFFYFRKKKAKPAE